jgi:hypothetical protein
MRKRLDYDCPDLSKERSRSANLSDVRVFYFDRGSGCLFYGGHGLSPPRERDIIQIGFHTYYV